MFTIHFSIAVFALEANMELIGEIEFVPQIKPVVPMLAITYRDLVSPSNKWLLLWY